VGTLVPIDGNIDSRKYVDVLDAHLWPVVCKHFAGKHFIFQDDNAPVHRSIFTHQWKSENGLSSVTWPAQSPDINIIENVWKVIKLHVQKDLSAIQSRQDLIKSVLSAWSKVHQTYIRQLYASIPWRIRSVIAQKGFITKY